MKAADSVRTGLEKYVPSGSEAPCQKLSPWELILKKILTCIRARIVFQDLWAVLLVT